MPGLGNRPSSLSFPPTPGRGSFRAIAVTINTGSQESRDAGGSTRMTQSCGVGATVRATPTSSVATRPDAAGYRSLQTLVRHEPNMVTGTGSVQPGLTFNPSRQLIDRTFPFNGLHALAKGQVTHPNSRDPNGLRSNVPTRDATDAGRFRAPQLHTLHRPTHPSAQHSNRGVHQQNWYDTIPQLLGNTTGEEKYQQFVAFLRLARPDDGLELLASKADQRG